MSSFITKSNFTINEKHYGQSLDLFTIMLLDQSAGTLKYREKKQLAASGIILLFFHVKC